MRQSSLKVKKAQSLNVSNSMNQCGKKKRKKPKRKTISPKKSPLNFLKKMANGTVFTKQKNIAPLIDVKEATPGKKTTPGKKITPGKKKGSRFFSSTPRSGKSKKAFDAPKPFSPRFLVQEYVTRGLMEPPVTIDTTQDNISMEDPVEVVGPSKKRKCRSFNFSKAKKMKKSDSVPSPEVVELSSDNEDHGRASEVNVVPPGSRDTSPEVQIIEPEQRAFNPQSIFSRWNIPGPKRKVEVEKEDQMPKEPKRSKFPFLKKRRRSNRIKDRFKNQAEEKKIRENIFYAGNQPPTFDPTLAPSYQFSSEQTGPIFRFDASKPSYPRMGIRTTEMSRSRLRVPSPTNIPPRGPSPTNNLPRTPEENEFYNCYYNPGPQDRTGLRPIIIDGQNIAFAHDESKNAGTGHYTGPPKFSSRGIDICIDFFKRRGHKHIIAFVPQHRLRAGQSLDVKVLHKLEAEGFIRFTPDRTYDDRFIVQYASICGGIVVTRDAYRDLLNSRDKAMKETIQKRRLSYVFVGDVLMFPEDPLGINGPTLSQFLSFDNP